jgi:hypothetical protein
MTWREQTNHFDRSKTPWIMAMSHFPLFHSQTTAHANMSAAHYTGDERMGKYAVGGNQIDEVRGPPFAR